MFNNISPFPPENRALYVILLKDLVRARQATDDDILRRMRVAYWVTKAVDTHTHTENVIRIVFPRQQWLCITFIHTLPVLLVFLFVFNVVR
jgi:hypothetical protein